MLGGRASLMRAPEGVNLTEKFFRLFFLISRGAPGGAPELRESSGAVGLSEPMDGSIFARADLADPQRVGDPPHRETPRPSGEPSLASNSAHGRLFRGNPRRRRTSG